jgi:hypothetical protein
MEPLHPAPTYRHRADHREAHNREQLRVPSELASIWRRAVEHLAAELQIEPLEAHALLREAEGEVTIGIAWEWWD